MVVCKFWLRGSCRNGDNCNFEHPPRQGNQYQGYQNQGQSARNGSSSSPFGQHTSDNSRKNGSNSFQRGGTATLTLPFTLDKKSIITDLKYERPQWILSAYGPGNKTTPTQLFGGPIREQSFEEMRLLHYIATEAGNPQQAINEVNALWQQSEQQMQATINNVDGAIDYIISGENEHPNRNEICEMSAGVEGGYKPTTLRPGTAASPFGAPSQPANTSAFGHPNQPNNVAFGQPSQQGNGAFGQPSQPSTGAFGQAAQANTSAFGQPSQPAAAAFGSSSALGQKPSPFGAPSFGAPSQPAGVFGKPNQASTSPFGQPSQPSNGAFGQPSVLGQSTSAFNAPAFGASSQPAAGAFSQQPESRQRPSPWGAPANTIATTSQPPGSNPFGQPSQPGTTSFPTSQPSPFGQPSQPSTFGQPSQPSPFSQPSGSSNFNPQPLPAATGFPPSQPSAFGQASQPSAFGQASQSVTSHSIPYDSRNAPSNTQQPASTGIFGQPSISSSNPNPNSASSSSYYQPGAGTGGNAAASSPKHPLISSTSQIFNGDTVSNRYPTTAFPPPRPLTAYASVTPDGLITTFKGKPVRYRGESREPWTVENGSWSKRIWCPKGFPAAGNTETEAEASKYTAEIEAAYSHLRLAGEFQGGVMPMIPPKKEWSSYEF